MKFKRVYIVEPVGGHGGMDLYDYGQSLGLAEQGYAVCLCTCAETVEMEFHLVRTNPTFGKVWQGGNLQKMYRFFKGYRKAFSAAKRDKASVLHLHFFQIGWLNWVVLQLARSYTIKKVVTLHDVDPLVHSAGAHHFRKLARRVDAIVVHNTFSRKELLGKGIPEQKIHVIPHGNYCEFIPELPPHPASDTLEILFFGQIKTVKGLDVLLEGLARAIQDGAKIRLTIAGRPWHADWSKFEKLIQLHNLSPHIQLRLEYIPNEEVAALFEAADLVVLPYRRIYQSGVLLLAMSYGRPCLCSDLEPFKEVIRDGENGRLFKDGSAEDLAQKLCALAGDRRSIEQLRMRTLETIREEYDWKIIGKQLADLYEALNAGEGDNNG